CHADPFHCSRFAAASKFVGSSTRAIPAVEATDAISAARRLTSVLLVQVDPIQTRRAGPLAAVQANHFKQGSRRNPVACAAGDGDCPATPEPLFFRDAQL